MPILEQLRAALAGRYAVERELGRGGMAVVFLAQDSKHHRPVAIKVLRPELAAALGAERFLREIEIAARLTHPHILPLYDSGEADGILYYVTPYIEGESLRDRLTREGQLPIEDALEIIRQAAGALGYAHSHDVVHRDIKPENILLAGDEVLVADFGIARAITAAGGERLTETGIAVGTPAYMSPEQAMGERALDGRSDVYSLACVLYETLAGEPPYTGPTAQAIMARRLTDPVPPLRTVRETVPAGVEQAIVRGLAKVPADRFATAMLFAAALRGGTAAPDSARRRRWGRLAIGAVALVPVAVVGTFVATHSKATKSLDANLVAVAPFEVRGASLGSWSEALVEYLSRSLDGAGDLQTVSPSVFLRRWNGRADPASAGVLGRRTGAGLVVFGSLVQGAGDSIRLRATLLDVAAGRKLEVEVSGDTLAIDRIADSLAVSLLRELGRTRPVGAVKNAPFGAASLPAIKEFLQGERFYRRGQFDSALAHDARAIALDSSLAIAYHRMSLVLSWDPPTKSQYGSTETYAYKAAALNHGLAPRDSMLIAADSCLFALFALSGLSDDSVYVALDLRRRLFTRLVEATRRFPGDPEIWIELGEARYWLEPFEAPEAALEAFDKAIALDSGFTVAYEHVLQLALQTAGEDRARQYGRAYLALSANEANSAGIRFAALLLDPVRSRSPETEQLVDTVGVRPLWQAGWEYLGNWADSAETAIRLLRAVPKGRRSVAGLPRWVADTLMWPQYLAGKLLYRGHAREAYEVYRPLIVRPNTKRWAWFASPLRDLALFNTIPPDTVTAVIARSLASDALAWRQWLPWWLARRDTAALARAVKQADSQARRSRSALESARARSWRSAAGAYLALVLGDSAAAIRNLQAMPDSFCQCEMQKLTLAQLLEARGDDRAAGEILDRWVWSLDGPSFIIARLERARTAERTGDREKATREYQFVADAWRHADAALQSYVTEARAGLRRLAGEPRR